MSYEQIELDALLIEVENPNFIPCPKLTLSIDSQKLENCGICQESQLLLRSGKKSFDDQTVAILPCGHIGGYEYTLAVGGEVSSQCLECSIATNTTVNKYLLDTLLESFKALRAAYHAEKSEHKKLELKIHLLTCKKRIDKSIEELAAFSTTAAKMW
ncbi:hypothetical protein Daus18300_003504 [Diaporthe australafricana]|uniref:Uncharacterized protein n=1 Tax=Diaporthe australafricana TaxID=127596 RepID=A0ABR3XEY5_9PEZI